NKSDTNGKCLPKESNSTNKVALASHHLSRPRTITSPSTNKNTIPAPKYHGPEVNCFSPQYVGRLAANCAACAGSAPLLITNFATFDSASNRVCIPPPYA